MRENLNWKKFWQDFWRFNTIAEAEESAVADIIALLFYLAGGGLLAHWFVNDATWALFIGLLSLLIGAIIFKVNYALARCKVAEEEDKNHP